MAGLITKDANLIPVGYQKISTLTAAVGLTVPAKARYAMVCPQTKGEGVMFRDDGSNPTATDGMPIAANEKVWYTGDLSAIKFIQAEASAVLHVLYYY